MADGDLALFGGKPAVLDGERLRQPPFLTEQDRQKVFDTLSRNELSYYTRQGWVAALEDEFESYHGRAHALAVDSGTSSLHSAFFGLGFGPGDEVLVPTYTFVATAMPLIQLGAVPRLCDCDPVTGNIYPSEIERQLTSRTRGVVVTHMWGHPCEMDEIVRLQKKHGLRLVEDCSHAHGATYKGRKVGTFGDAACFSLQAKKIVTGGTGGVMITDDAETYERAVLLGHSRARSKEAVQSELYDGLHVTGLGLNYRIHPLAAALATSQFRRLDEIIAERSARLDHLSRQLKQMRAVSPPVTLPHVTRGAFHGYKPLFVPAAASGLSKARYVEALQAEGVAVQLPGTTPLHRTALFTRYSESLVRYGSSRAADDGLAPWTVDPERDGAFANCEDYLGRVLDHTTFTHEPFDLIDQYVKAFAKVDRFADRLSQDDQDAGQGSARE
jgi:dTDP-4-amino-4,6-dideoxygalactose transaminase